MNQKGDSEVKVIDDLFQFALDTLSEGTLTILLGEVNELKISSSYFITNIYFSKKMVNARNIRALETAAVGIANLTGAFQNMSFMGRYFSTIFRWYTWSVFSTFHSI